MIEIRDEKSPESIADYIEYYVISSCKPLSKAKISNLFPDIKEDKIDSIFSELENRNSLYGDSSPILLEGTIVKPNFKWERVPALMLCLIFSLEGVKKKKGKKDGTKLFERLSKDVARNYLKGKAEVIGSPNKYSLKKQITIICKKTFEVQGVRSPRPNDKDKGLDVIAWKPHGDNRPNQVIILLQCAAGIHYDSKKPISLTTWRDFINWSVTPLRGIVLPSILSEDNWNKVRDDHDLIFDRVRIHKACNTGIGDAKLKKQIISWCKEKIKASA